jgi:hypothetical protein
MADFYPELSGDMVDFIEKQRIFFVASAPPGAEGRVNISPKGYSCFTVIDSKTVAYIDYPGSGNETADHISRGGRVTVMFCSFDKKPMILRLYCRGEVVPLEKADRIIPASKLVEHPYARQLILLHVEEVMTSCGYGVPYYRFQGDREALRKSSEKEGGKGWLRRLKGG